MKSFLNKNIAKSRGIRNNNPGNLRKTSIPWKGKVPHSMNTDGSFEQFHHVGWGIRAIIIDLKNKIDRGLDTIPKILEVYAPKTENNTMAYIERVSRQTGIGKHRKLQANRETLFKLTSAIISVENLASERHLITDTDIDASFRLVDAEFTKAATIGGFGLIGLALLSYGFFKTIKK